MCGIAGLVGSNNHNSVDWMVKCMRHRGPDDSGVMELGNAVIGMSRLAILDLSPSGHQPMVSHCKRYAIVYNGECYNFREIRSKLEALGEVFISQSDTEVVLQAYVHWGEECLQMMNGMFAFAIWDTQEETLFAARDHIGIKPFYYTQQGGNFIFASEVQTLLEGGVSSETDTDAVFQYFTFGHIQQPKTILQRVKALMPGHCLTWRNSQINIKPYWSLLPKPLVVNYEEAKEMLFEQINRSVRMQLVSDRPLGLFLSGGLDSASVLAAMHARGANIRTFSIGFDETPFARNEANEAEDLARHFGAEHRKIMLNAAVVKNEILSFWNALDQPSVDGLNTYLVSKYAREHMTVALSGLGGDELFAGYSRHARNLWKLANIKSFSSFINDILPEKLLTKKGILGSLSYRIKQNVDRKSLLRNYTYTRSLGPLNDSISLLSADILNGIDAQCAFYSQYINLDTLSGTTDLNKVLALEVKSFMGSVLLRDMDVTSMRHSLEVRFPLIDYKLVELAFSLPDKYKLDFNVKHKPPGEGKLSYIQAGNKKILMDIMKPFLPEGFGNRSKNGFKLPISYWLKGFKKDELKAMILDERKSWDAYLNYEVVKAIVDKDLGNNNDLLWRILCFIKTIPISR